MKTILALLALLALAAPAAAQIPVTAGQHLSWEHGAATLAEADAQGINIYIDAAQAVPGSGKTCTVPAPTPGYFMCTAAIPAMTPGLHVLMLTATLGTQESPRSDPLSIKLVIVLKPGNVTIVDLMDFALLHGD